MRRKRNRAVKHNRRKAERMEWNEEHNAVTKDFSFADFSEALAFVNCVGKLAEAADHHPDMFIHDYKHVRITLMTHSEGKVTDKDRSLAKQIDVYAGHETQ